MYALALLLVEVKIWKYSFWLTWSNKHTSDRNILIYLPTFSTVFILSAVVFLTVLCCRFPVFYCVDLKLLKIKLNKTSLAEKEKSLWLKPTKPHTHNKLLDGQELFRYCREMYSTVFTHFYGINGWTKKHNNDKLPLCSLFCCERIKCSWLTGSTSPPTCTNRYYGPF